MTDTPPAVNNTQSSADNSTAATQSSASSSADENNPQSTGQNATSQTQQNSTEPSGQNITDTESQNSTDAFGHNFTDSAYMAYVNSTDTVKTNNTENVVDDQITEKDNQTGADIDITTEPLNTTRTVTETEDTRAENSTVPANTTGKGINTATGKSQQQSYSEYQFSFIGLHYEKRSCQFSNQPTWLGFIYTTARR